MQQRLFFVLGAPDPEMNAIEHILEKLNINYGYATDTGGFARVKSYNAYQGRHGIHIKKGPFNLKSDFTVAIECAGLPDRIRVDMRIDHHYPGDPGYDCDHTQFWEGSSLGQLTSFLEKWGYSSKAILAILPPDTLLAAASDHCPAHATQGLIDIIDVDAFNRYRIANAVRRTNKPADVVERQILESVDKIRACKSYVLEGETIYTTMNPNAIPYYADASLRGALSVEYTLPDPKGGMKLRISNVVRPEVVEAWIELKKDGLTDIYGVPKRGFAGGYIQATEKV